MTVLEVIQRSTDFLSKRGVDSPRLQVELLLAHLLTMPRLNLYLEFERTLTPAELDKLREMVKRRGNREPLQHIIGSISFCGLEMKVTPDVLIPRPETELLAECGAEFLHALAGEERRSVSFLDLGTGSGCLAVMMAVQCPTAQAHATDISNAALSVARENADRHHVSDRIQFHHGNLFDAISGEFQVDLVISNPPYIATAEIPTLAPEVRDHDPRLALDGGPDGLKFYRLLAKEAGKFLRTSGKLMAEFGDGQEEEIERIFTQEEWRIEGVKSDYTGRPRILIARRNES